MIEPNARVDDSPSHAAGGFRRQAAYSARHGGAPPSPRRERREAEAATRLQSNFRGMRDRSATRVKQRMDAWDELDMHDEIDFLQKHSALSSVGRCAEQLGREGGDGYRTRSPSRLRRTSTHAEWDALAGRAPPPPPRSYRGPQPAWPLTNASVETMIDHFRREPEEPLYEGFAMAILTTIRKQLEDSYGGAVQDLSVPTVADAQFIVVGDTHGQLKDFLWILMEKGLPSDSTTYLINGDVADRGENAVEIFLIIFALKLIHPDKIFFNRGNHEMEEMNQRDGGFMHEVRRKYGRGHGRGRIFKLFQAIFDLWPIAAVLNERVMVLHGGVPRKRNVSLQLLRNISCKRQLPQDPHGDEEQLFFDCLWNDPHEGRGLTASSRGDGCVQFGVDTCRNFLKKSKLGMLVRSHECPRERGYMEHHGGRTFTVFSASNYCGSMGNLGGVMIFNERLEFVLWEYMAPALWEQAEMYSRGAVSAADARGLERQASVEVAQRQTETMDEMILQKLKELIVEKRTDLWWYYHHQDDSRGGRITPTVWRDGLVDVLDLERVPIMSYRNTLATVEADGMIDYNRFLNRYILVQEEDDSGTSQSGWQTDVVCDLYAAVLGADLSLRDTFAIFDRDGDGRGNPSSSLPRCFFTTQAAVHSDVRGVRDGLPGVRSLHHAAPGEAAAA